LPSLGSENSLICGKRPVFLVLFREIVLLALGIIVCAVCIFYADFIAFLVTLSPTHHSNFAYLRAFFRETARFRPPKASFAAL
jgi:hypothetical protein